MNLTDYTNQRKKMIYQLDFLKKDDHNHKDF